MRYTAILPHIYEWHPATWAKKHCPSYLSATAHLCKIENEDQSKVEYHFAEERDLTMFLLRWL